MRVLVADDDPIVLRIVESIVERAGFEAVVASDGEEALTAIEHLDVRLIVTDWNMPRVSGLELCRRLRAAPSVNYVFIILLTSRENHEDAIEGLSAGADDFLRKPVDPLELTIRLQNAKRLLELETSSVTIFALAKLAESKDPETGRHLDRIRAYSRILAARLAKDFAPTPEGAVAFVELVFRTSPLHDIGKVGIPDSVLLKPGRLSDAEFSIMKQHAEIGAQTLSDALGEFPGADFLRMARDIAWCHHERWDGSGYPRGLRGDEIPPSARIVALADVYDALTMRRVYKSAMEHDVARGIIVESRGTHFDPAVVDAFLELEPGFVEIRNRFADR